MKNKFFIFCLILFLNINLNYEISANEFNFKSGVLKIKENGELIEATKNVEILTDNSLKIYADKSILQKEISLLKASGNVRLIDIDENINMKANFISYDKVKNLIKRVFTWIIFFLDNLNFSKYLKSLFKVLL